MQITNPLMMKNRSTPIQPYAVSQCSSGNGWAPPAHLPVRRTARDIVEGEHREGGEEPQPIERDESVRRPGCGVKRQFGPVEHDRDAKQAARTGN